MNKKAAEAVGSYSLFLMIASIALVMIALTTSLFMFSYKSSLTETSPVLESTILSSRFFNQKECFAYQDSISERTYSKVIDYNKFTKQILDSCYPTKTTKDFQFQLKLKNLDTNEEKTLQTLEWYNVPKFTLKQNLIIKKGDEQFNGQLLIIVQTPI